MVETKDSAALFLPSTEALSHGRSARRIGRVRSHKRSLRNQFHLFVNTQKDFHSLGGIPPQDHLLCGSIHFIASRRVSSNRAYCRPPESSVSSRVGDTGLCFFSPLPPHPLSPSVSLLKNNRRVSEASEISTCKLTRNACRKSAGLSPPLSHLRSCAPSTERTRRAPASVARKDIISFSAL